MKRGWSARGWTILALVAVLAATAISWTVLHGSSKPKTDTQAVGSIVDKKVQTAITALKGEPSDGVGVYANVRPELVVIQADGVDGGHDTGLGSGVVIDDQGHILTALHVVKGAAHIGVSFADGTQSPASITSTDPDHDLAVLIADHPPDVIVPAVLGGGPRVGDETFAVGHPLGLVASLTAGVISGLDRSAPMPDGHTISGLIQFDAAVNPGNSGGPLLNRKGQVIGIVTGLANPAGDGDFVGIGFAVPIATAGRAAGAPAQ